MEDSLQDKHKLWLPCNTTVLCSNKLKIPVHESANGVSCIHTCMQGISAATPSGEFCVIDVFTAHTWSFLHVLVMCALPLEMSLIDVTHVEYPIQCTCTSLSSPYYHINPQSIKKLKLRVRVEDTCSQQAW